MSVQHKLIRYSDHIGISGSVFCLIHCIITSGVLILSTAGSHLHHHDLHDHHHAFDIWAIIDLSMILISGLAIFWATSKSSLKTKRTMWIIFTIYALTMLLKYIGMETMGITILSYASSFSLIGFHLFNISNRQSACCDHPKIKSKKV